MELSEAEEFEKEFWRYYIFLEKKVAILNDYIEFEKSNLKVYSREIYGLLQLVGSEIETVMRKISNLDDERYTIKDYRSNILACFPTIRDEVIRTDIGTDFFPFKDWSEAKPSKSLSWWESYNKIKHNRKTAFKKANLGNLLISLSALCLLERLFLKSKGKEHVEEESEFFRISGFEKPYDRLAFSSGVHE